MLPELRALSTCTIESGFSMRITPGVVRPFMTWQETYVCCGFICDPGQFGIALRSVHVTKEQ